jgi:hypothetical protein
MFRTTFSHHAALVLSALRRCGARGMEDCLSEGRGQTRQGGSIMGLHTPGRHGQYHPPLPLIAPRGGLDGQGQRWEPLQYGP